MVSEKRKVFGLIATKQAPPFKRGGRLPDVIKHQTKGNKMTIDDKMTKARQLLMLNETFFASLLLRLKSTRNDAIKTACVDGVSMEWSGDYIQSLTIPEIVTVLAHEVLHCALLHFARRGGRDLKQWNIATDYAINEQLQELNEQAQAKGLPLPFPFPQGALLDSRFRGKSAEEIYSVLQSEAQKQESGGQSPQQSPQQSQGGGQGNKPQPSQKPQGGQAKGQGGQGKGKPQPSQGNGGQGESEPDTGAGMGDVKDTPSAHEQTEQGETPKDGDEISEDWKQAAVQAATLAKGRGNLPGAMARLVEDLLNPRKNWREILRDLIRQSAKDDYSFSRPNPRYAGTGFFLPSLHSQRLGEIAIAVDTSGSIFPAMLKDFLTEVESIAHETRPEKIILMDCDASVQSFREFEPFDVLPKDLKGGGGTSFIPPVECLDNANRLPVCLIYFTDLDGAFPKEAPAYPVIWATHQTRRVPFGTVVEIKD